MPTPASVPTSSETSLQRPIGSGLPRVGEWLWTCRAGFESDLGEELSALRVSARMVEPGLVAGSKCPPGELSFARQGLPVQAAFAVPLPETKPSQHAPIGKERVQPAWVGARFTQGRVGVGLVEQQPLNQRRRPIHECSGN